MRRRWTIFALAALAACSREQPPEPKPVATEIPKSLQAAPPRAEQGELGTPMKDRVATLGLLNKRNNLSQDLKLKPGELKRVGDVIVRLAACERTAPWEQPRETGAFVQVLVRKPGNDDQWLKVFSGWLFKNSPSLNVVEHPIYDVWVKDCAMRFPGEEDVPGATPSATPATPKAPTAAPAPAPSSSPAATSPQ